MSHPCVDAKVVFLGSSSVGKTSVIFRAASDEFDPEMPATIGASYTSKTVELDEITVNLQIWDTAGQERFRTLAPMYYRGSQIAILVYAINDQPSLKDVKNWHTEMKGQVTELPIFFVVGNKVDLIEDRTVTTEEAEDLAKEINAHYYEISAKSGRGIEELFIKVAEEVQKLNTKTTTPVTAVTTGVDLGKSKKPAGKQGCC